VDGFFREDRAHREGVLTLGTLWKRIARSSEGMSRACRTSWGEDIFLHTPFGLWRALPTADIC